MSKKNKLITWMLTRLSTTKYGWRTTVDGCYDTAIEHYHFEKPEESKEEIVDFVIKVLNNN